MKTKLALKAAALAAVVLSTASAYAGPGLQYWAARGHNVTASNSSTPAVKAVVCAASKDVPVTVIKPTWPNGRGPLTPVQVGTKRVCTVCSTSGGTHTCKPNCPPAKS